MGNKYQLSPELILMGIRLNVPQSDMLSSYTFLGNAFLICDKGKISVEVIQMFQKVARRNKEKSTTTIKIIPSSIKIVSNAF